jgi:hypothetical protein
MFHPLVVVVSICYYSNHTELVLVDLFLVLSPHKEAGDGGRSDLLEGLFLLYTSGTIPLYKSLIIQTLRYHILAAYLLWPGTTHMSCSWVAMLGHIFSREVRTLYRLSHCHDLLL